MAASSRDTGGDASRTCVVERLALSDSKVADRIADPLATSIIWAWFR
tara:strand:- start:254 stop:394 length:141 start_codon:yes stop_codon:yes gene_type:complete